VRLYLDACCLNRPFDEQVQLRVRLETQAVMHILEACSEGRHTLVAAMALEVEIGQTPNPERRENVRLLIGHASLHVKHSQEIDRRSAELVALAFGNMDAYHVASAESGGCDRLITTDDRFLKCAARHASRLSVTITNPVQLIAEASFL
jgi:predicted nucleic acid-binding protein